MTEPLPSDVVSGVATQPPRTGVSPVDDAVAHFVARLPGTLDDQIEAATALDHQLRTQLADLDADRTEPPGR